MENRVWINGTVLLASQAGVRIEDRGYQFADGVYEVIRLYNGQPFGLAEHLARLRRSADAIQLTCPLTMDDLDEEIRYFIVDETAADAMIYLQLTRGVAHRNHAFPADVRPAMLFYAMPLDPLPPVGESNGMSLLPIEDERWKKCHIKSIALLANVLAKQEAITKGFDEAIFIDDGMVMEGATTNLFAVIAGQLVTPPEGRKILAGITRRFILDLAPTIGVVTNERPIRLEEMDQAEEIFLTSSTREVMWVNRWNHRPIASTTGPITRRVHEAYKALVVKAGT